MAELRSSFWLISSCFLSSGAFRSARCVDQEPHTVPEEAAAHTDAEIGERGGESARLQQEKPGEDQSGAGSRTENTFDFYRFPPATIFCVRDDGI